MEEDLKVLEHLIKCTKDKRDLLYNLEDETKNALERIYKKENELLKQDYEIECLNSIFKDLTRQYEKSKSFKVGMLSNGENVIYKTVKLNELEYSFMKDFLKANNGELRGVRYE